MLVRDFMETTTMYGLRNVVITFTDGLSDFSFTRDMIYGENWFSIVEKYYDRKVKTTEFFNFESDGKIEVRLWIE